MLMTGDGFDGGGTDQTLASVADQDTFVVRVWTTGLPGVVRGHVQHIRSRRSVHFANRQRLQSFIEEQLRLAGLAIRTGPVPRRRGGVDGLEPS
jgi:hypothetical protein